MVVYTDKKSLINKLNSFRENQKKIGFVPTMGALHQGHLSLIARSVDENEVTVVSIFVNPTQFDNPKDLAKYPRTLESDLKLIKTLAGNILVFNPSVSSLYNEKVTSKHFRYGGLENQMEGKHRKGHFDGVGTILSIFFRMINPHNAYFGQKDFQQLQIVKKLVEIEDLDVNIVGCPIVREPNGLAMSSRNKRLSQKQRKEASLLNEVLTEVKKKFKSHSIAELNTLVKERFLNSNMKLEYFEIANEDSLKTVKQKRKNKAYRAFLAAFAGEVRLIDNMALN
ncbi:pantoate--beta-alanine ligase [Constantimarinum furrinae]|uniref:Pantothenate synthetase n=1 Tax=Constantimarinum furrinae TaxID=2562285 RepID=A0A7G8PSH0_9FLAO|nr:pantoate--beta-alanine ligase [Constantimarinum furrinae]QNJ97286.1 pantoate--beta-alanine ligase [Constantimarinum furrinae]